MHVKQLAAQISIQHKQQMVEQAAPPADDAEELVGPTFGAMEEEEADVGPTPPKAKRRRVGSCLAGYWSARPYGSST